MRWATCDDLGYIAFPTKKAALAAYPERKPVHCEFAMNFLGWLSTDYYGTDNGNTVKTPDGREIPVVSGMTATGRLMGMRGGKPRSIVSDEWQAIMVRVVDAGLAFHNYKQNGYSHTSP